MSLLHVLVVSSVAVAALNCAPKVALAGCALPPQISFSPANASLVPQNPAVFVFFRTSALYPANTLDGLAVEDAAGNKVSFARDDLSTAKPGGLTREDPKVPNGKVVRLKVSATRGTFTVTVRAGATRTSATFQIANGLPKERVETASETDIVEATYAYSTSCPSDDGFILHVTPKAAAYEVTARDKKWIVPDLSVGLGVDDGHGVIVTGSIGCQDFTIPDVRPFEITFVPLFSDGERGEWYSPNCRQTNGTRTVKKGANGPRSVVGASITCSSVNYINFTGKVRHQ